MVEEAGGESGGEKAGTREMAMTASEGATWLAVGRRATAVAIGAEARCASGS